MTKQPDMFAGCNLHKFVKVPRTSLVRINHTYGKPIGKLFLHNLGYLIAALLMIAASGTNQSLHKIGVNVAFGYYEIRTPVHFPR